MYTKLGPLSHRDRATYLQLAGCQITAKITQKKNYSENESQNCTAILFDFKGYFKMKRIVSRNNELGISGLSKMRIENDVTVTMDY